MFRRAVSVLLIAVTPVLAHQGPASAEKSRRCEKTVGVGKNCITINSDGAGGHRVSVAWKYQEPRNVGVPTPIKRSVWQANVLCEPRVARIDVLRFWGADRVEVMLTAEQQANIVAGLESEVLPQIASALCE